MKFLTMIMVTEYKDKEWRPVNSPWFAMPML
jgi:hypothetical protein